nr:hypothetical protein [Tanacetum cinerariifolium]
ERLTSVFMKDISDDSSNDPLLEEGGVFLASDNSIPSGIKNFGYDSEGDIRFIEELLIDDSIPFPNNESFNFEDDSSFPRPSPKPPDAEFGFKPDAGEEISDELNKDNFFDFLFMFIIRIFLPYLIYPEVFPLLLSAESEDTIFDPDISVYSWRHLIGIELSCAFMFIKTLMKAQLRFSFPFALPKDELTRGSSQPK